MCVSQFTVLLMRLLPAHSRKPASDIYLRDYLIGGVVWVKREVCNVQRVKSMGYIRMLRNANIAAA